MGKELIVAALEVAAGAVAIITMKPTTYTITA